jgi:hypothetical protein
VLLGGGQPSRSRRLRPLVAIPKVARQARCRSHHGPGIAKPEA